MMEPARPWTALAPDGPLAARARAAIDDIAGALARPPPPLDGDAASVTGLMAREPGLAVFYAYLDRARPRARWRRLAERFLARAVAKVPDASDRPFFSFGFPGTAWALEHLGLAGEGEDDINADIDAALIELVEQGGLPSPTVHAGIAGLGVYAIERLPRPGGAALLAAVVRRLDAMAERRGPGLAWRVPGGMIIGAGIDGFPEGYVDLGIMNGAAGVVAVAANAVAWNVERAAAERIVEGGLAWIWSCRPGALFDLPPRLHLACSGGALGLATCVAAAARAIGAGAWRERALALAERLAGVRGRAVAGANSALGEGLAGTVHAFLRLHHETGDPRFADEARRRLAQLLGRRRPGQGLGGYRFHSKVGQRKIVPGLPVGWLGLPGLRNGSAGIGLALLAATQPIEPAWDRMLLLSQRRPPA